MNWILVVEMFKVGIFSWNIIDKNFGLVILIVVYNFFIFNCV